MINYLKMSDIQKQLEELNQKIKKCTACDLCQERIQAVPGEGASPDDIEVLFVGEGPGANEDKQGRPFCGASGKFLDEMLDHIGFSREKKIYITNIVKCRPPENRDPKEEEKETCSDLFLKKQIEIFQPKLVVTLGRHAMNFFLPSAKIGAAHGQFFRRRSQDYVILPLYHPAVALYNGGKRDELKKEFERITVFLKQEGKGREKKEEIPTLFGED